LRSLLSVFVYDIQQKIDVASLMFQITDTDEINNTNNVKVVTDPNDFAMYFSRSPIPFARDKAFVKYYKHIGIYAFKKDALLRFTELEMTDLERAEKLENLRFLAYGMHVKMVKTTHQPIGIDTPEDLELARKLLND
jgi:3-deoxy-manno-octulosonate cytidylyltransferase (CMP-KDO synthetase)